ncbi:aminotransferase class III-fold pyridoxal phosphate-dependent enzyme [bacterium]|nr:aminotransferase class III-fold pyridoxal phosphate-dependent enzyme [bacterium]
MQLPSESEVKLWYQQHVNGGFLSLVSFMGLDSTEVEAEGWTVRTADGREFIDCVGGYGSYNFGHRHPAILAAVSEQLGRMPMSSKLLLNGQLAGLAHDLAQVTPAGLDYSFISNSGTEAVEAALKLARLTTGKPGVISATNAYHGKTLGSLSSTHRPSYQTPFAPLMDHFGEVPFGDADALEAAINEHTGAVMLEPVQGEGGIILAPPGYLTAVREITRRRGVLFIADEVQTGLGRTGRNFACEFEGVEPDMMVLAKSLGGGVMPIGATIGTARVWEKFQQDPLVHTSTFGGNELACAAGRAAIALLQSENLAQRAAENGRLLLEGLRALQARYPQVIREVRGIGMMIGIDTFSQDISQLFIANVIEQKVLVAFTLNRPKVIRMEPPLTMSASVISEVLQRMDTALAATAALMEQYGLAEPDAEIEAAPGPQGSSQGLQH